MQRRTSYGHILYGATPGIILRLIRLSWLQLTVRGLTILGMSLLVSMMGTPIRWWESWRYRSRLNKIQIKAPIFILGFPRSGTTHLMYVLARDPAFQYCQTWMAMGPGIMLTFGTIMRKIATWVLPSRRPMDGMPMAADLPVEEEFALGNMTIASMVHGMYLPSMIEKWFAKTVFLQDSKIKKQWKKAHQMLLRKLTLLQPDKTLLNKSPFDTARIDAILECYPDARFIHIARDPRRVYASNRNLYRDVLPHIALQDWDNKIIDQFIRQSYPSIYQRYVDTKSRLAPSQLIEIHHEDFIRTPVAVVQRIYAWLDIPDVHSRMVLYNDLKLPTSYQNNPYTLSAIEERNIEAEWEIGFRLFGYPEKKTD